MKKHFSKYSRKGLPGGANEQQSFTEGFIVSSEGQYKYPGMNTMIPNANGRITMSKVGYPVLGIDDLGNSIMMQPGGEYQFPGNHVFEIPLPKAQMGIIGTTSRDKGYSSRFGSLYPFLAYKSSDKMPYAGVEYIKPLSVRDPNLEAALAAGIYGSPEKAGVGVRGSSKYSGAPVGETWADLYGGYGTDQGGYAGLNAYQMFPLLQRKNANIYAGGFGGYEMQSKLPSGIVSAIQSGDAYFDNPQKLPFAQRLPLSSGFRYGPAIAGNVGNFKFRAKGYFDPVQGKLADPDPDNPIIKAYAEKVGTDKVHWKPSFEISAGYTFPVDNSKKKIRAQIEKNKTKDQLEEEREALRVLDQITKDPEEVDFVKQQDLKKKMLESPQKETRYRFQDGGESKDAMNAMMKARLAYANEFGNPAAQRMIVAPDQPYDFGDGDYGTHYMANIDNYAVPQIQNVNGQLVLGDFGPRSNEAIKFDRPEDAAYFARHYKDIAPDPLYREYKKGGNTYQDGGEGFELELTDEQIEQYKKGGYIVEELPKAQVGGEEKDSWGRSSNSIWYNFDPEKKQYVSKDAWGRPPGSEWYGFNPESKKWTLGNKAVKQQQQQEDALKQRNKETVEFYKQYMNSPRYKEMLGFEPIMDAQRKANFGNTSIFDMGIGSPFGIWSSFGIGSPSVFQSKSPKVTIEKSQPKDSPTTGGYSKTNTGDIFVLPKGYNVKGIFPHEWSHSIDRPVNDDGERLMPQKDIDYIEKTTVKDEDILKVPGLQDYSDYTLDELKRDYPEWIQDEIDWKNYVATPTEVRARLNDIRFQSKKRKLYDPFTQKVTPEIYEKLKNTEFETGEEEGFDALKQLKGIYTDEQIMYMLNNISQNTPSNNNTIDYTNENFVAKLGGLVKAQKGTVDPSKMKRRTSLLDKYDIDPALTLPKPEVAESTKPKNYIPSKSSAANAVKETKQVRDAGAQMIMEDPTLSDEQKYQMATSPQKSIDYYNTILTAAENQGTIEKKVEQSAYDRVKDYALNPDAAIYYAMKGESMPGNYEAMIDAGINPMAGERGGNTVLSGLNMFLNPIAGVYDFGEGVYEGDLEKVGMGALGILPALSLATKPLTKSFKKLKSIPKSSGPKSSGASRDLSDYSSELENMGGYTILDDLMKKHIRDMERQKPGYTKRWFEGHTKSPLERPKEPWEKMYGTRDNVFSNFRKPEIGDFEFKPMSEGWNAMEEAKLAASNIKGPLSPSRMQFPGMTKKIDSDFSKAVLDKGDDLDAIIKELGAKGYSENQVMESWLAHMQGFDNPYGKFEPYYMGMKPNITDYAPTIRKVGKAGEDVSSELTKAMKDYEKFKSLGEDHPLVEGLQKKILKLRFTQKYNKPRFDPSEWNPLKSQKIDKEMDPYNLGLRLNQKGGSVKYNIGDEVDEATMKELEKLGYTFEEI